MRGDRLKHLREQSNFTQRELAERLNISESQIFRYEKDEIEPRADVVVKFAEFFNVSTDYLLGVSDEMALFAREKLSARERAIIGALRRGENYQAIKAIVDED